MISAPHVEHLIVGRKLSGLVANAITVMPAHRGALIYILAVA